MMFKILMGLIFLPSVMVGQLIVPITISYNGITVGDTFGCSATATYCLDGPITPTMWEEELAPPGPDMLDVRFVGHRGESPCLGMGTRIHFQEILKLDTFRLRILVPTDGVGPFILSWPKIRDITDGTDHWRSLYLQDTVDGTQLHIDMMTDTVFQIPGLIPKAVQFIGVTDVWEGVHEGPELPGIARLDQNYPNPFNGSTRINYELSRQEHVEFSVSDLLGRSVFIINNVLQSAGVHSIELHSDNLSTGVYLYQLKVGDIVHSKKLVVVK
jgi:hypothetical protein